MISVGKVTVNIGVGESGEKLEQARKLLESMTGQKAVETVTQKRIPKWGVRKNMKIGVKTTLRGKEAIEFMNRTMEAIDKTIKSSSFDSTGNFSYGIREYIDVPGVKYDPDIGMFGFDVCVTLRKWGYRVKERKIKKNKVPKKHMITKEEAMEFAKKELNVVIS